jgi:hypothetical protein
LTRLQGIESLQEKDREHVLALLEAFLISEQKKLTLIKNNLHILPKAQATRLR